MAYKIDLPIHSDARAKLTVIEKLPFEIKRVFYIYDAKLLRGGHRHRECQLAMIALNGTIEIDCNNGKERKVHILAKPTEALIVPPEDWTTMNLSPGSTLLVLASHVYDEVDYIYENYP